MSQDKKHVHYGGQAIIEGVMMRGRDNFGVACRKKSSGEIVTSCEPVLSVLKKLKWLNKPFLRGTLALVDSMALGMKALTFSADVAANDEETAKTDKPGDDPPAPASDGNAGSRKQQVINGIAISGAMIAALGLSVCLFVLIPVRVTMLLKGWTETLPAISIGFPWLRIGGWSSVVISSPVQGRVILGVVEGSLKMAILLGYVLVISKWGEIHRVFQYHGAEHKTINAYEAGEPLEVDKIQKYSTVHVRCGTSFLLLVIMTSIVVFAFIPWKTTLQRFELKMLLLPLVAGIAYEIIRLAGRRKDSRFLRAILAPGLLMQRITTKEPSDDQVEVAIQSLRLVLDVEAAAAEPSTSATASAPHS